MKQQRPPAFQLFMVHILFNKQSLITLLLTHVQIRDVKRPYKKYNNFYETTVLGKTSTNPLLF